MAVPAEVRLVRSAVGTADSGSGLLHGGGMSAGSLIKSLAANGAAPQLVRDCVLGACAAKVLGRGSSSSTGSRPPTGPVRAVLGNLPWVLAASLAAGPFDLAKTRIQASQSSGSLGGSATTNLLREAFKEEGGLAGLLRGTLPLAVRYAAGLLVLGWLRDRSHGSSGQGGGQSSEATYEVLLQYESLFPPAATEAERLRFLRASYGDVEAAAASLTRYLDWREGHGRSNGAGLAAGVTQVGGTGGGRLQLARRGKDGDRDWEEATAAAFRHHAGSSSQGVDDGRGKKRKSGKAGGSGSGSTTPLPRTTYGGEGRPDAGGAGAVPPG